MVSIYATVRADDGRLVPDLTKDDFEVKDNGTVREITAFSREIVPITVAVMLDMSGSVETGVNWMRDAGLAFVGELLPTDRARIGTFGREIAISPRLTSDKTYLRRVLTEEIWPGGGTPLWEALDLAMTSLANESGRRVILALTDGLDSTSASRPPALNINSNAVTPASQALAGAQSAWSFNGGRYDEVRHRSIREDFMLYAVGRVISQGPATDGTDLTYGMRELAVDSGGGFRIFPAKYSAGAAMAQVAEELHHQYLIGFTPTTIDNKVHNLDVKVKRGGMSAQARKSYLATVK